MAFAENDGGPDGNARLAEVFGSRLFLGASIAVTRAFWISSLLDLRPDLRSASGSAPTGTSVQLVPSSGTDVDLWWQVFSPNLFGITVLAIPSTAQLRIQAVEFGSPLDPARVLACTAPIDITAQVLQGNKGDGAAIVRFPNLGPLRYWQLGISVDIEAFDFSNLDGPVEAAAGAY